MRRRRRKNPLLTRILLISVGIHILALPILAHFGTLRAIQRRYFDTQMVVLAPPKIALPEEREKPKVVAKQQTARSNKASTGQRHATAQQHLSNLPPVVASQGGADIGGPTVDQGGTGKAGVVPTAPGKGQGGDGQPATITAPQATGSTTEKPVDKPPVVTTTNPATTTTTPTPVVKHVPVYADAQPTFSPQPAIPEDLRYDAVDKTTVVEFVVGPDGTPSGARVATSCGIEALDQAALDSVKQWRFKPATRDGEPIARTVRLKVEFKVD